MSEARVSLDERGATTPAARWRSSLPSPEWLLVMALCVLALALRILWTLTHTYAIENEGAEYARIAQNLTHGTGYVGLQPGPELLFPPLYPWLIAALAPLVGGVENAGRAVSVLAGTSLVLPVYLLGRRLYGVRTAIVAGAAIALSPLLIGFSSAVLSEPTYLTLQITAAYLLLRAHDLASWKLSIASGAFWGLAALVRPEAALILGLLTAVGVLYHCLDRARLRAGLIVAVAALATCVVVFLPYSIWTSVHAGRVQINGKATVTAFLDQRIGAGQSYAFATGGLDAAGNPTGALLRPNDFISGREGATPPISLKTTLHNESKGAHTIWSYFGRRHLTGAPVITLLALIAIVSGPWTRRKIASHGLLLLLGIANVLIFGAVGWFEFRFLVPLIPFALLFASHGIVRCAELATSAVNQRRSRPIFSAAQAVAVFGVIGIALLALLPMRAVTAGRFPSLAGKGTVDATGKVVGEWLHHNGSQGTTVVSTSATLAFYAGATWYPMGYTDSDEAATTYIDSTNASFLVLTSTESEPYVARWLASGVPDSKYHLLKTFKLNNSTTAVYGR